MTNTSEIADRWAVFRRPSTPPPLPSVPLPPDFFDDPTYLAQNPPEEVVAASVDPFVEVHVEEIEEVVEVSDLQEFLAMQEEEDNAMDADLDFDGLDITDQKTSAGKEGDAGST
jgi:hypothetical protein